MTAEVNVKLLKSGFSIDTAPMEELIRYDAVSRGFVHYETVAARLADAMRDLGVPLEESVFCSRHNGCSLHRH